MKLFSRRVDGGAGAPNTVLSNPQPTEAGAECAITDTLLDALANLLRVYGGNGFDVEGLEAAELERRCETWARHILTGTPAPLETDPPTAKSNQELLPRHRRHWGDLLGFFRQHRRNERNAMVGRSEQMRGLISEVASGLRVAISDDSAKDRLIAREMSALTEALESNSLAAIRTQVSKTIETVSTVVRERQSRYEAQLRSMGRRVRELRVDLLEMRDQVNLDRLTQVHNRGSFDTVLAKQVDFSLLSAQPLALMMVDLDHFKTINDTYGHPAGDLVLQAAADAIVRVCPRRSDFIARYGGEEFALILVDVSEMDLEAISERLLKAMRELSVEYHHSTISVRCSIGISLFQTEYTPEELLRRADQALYRAKHKGRDRAVFDDS
jgi:diguanylate cyclase (GGDEF)-like protein